MTVTAGADSYTRRASVVRVIDGDTAVLDVDLGFYLTCRMSCRLYGINAPELHAPDPAPGEAARDRLAELLPAGQTVAVWSVKPDKYAGRFDGVVWLPSTLTRVPSWPAPGSVNSLMLDAGLAVPYLP